MSASDASLGVGHIWTAVACPAYASGHSWECVCGSSLRMSRGSALPLTFADLLSRETARRGVRLAVQGTGGGCTALVAYPDDETGSTGREYLVTDDASVPVWSETDPGVCIGEYVDGECVAYVTLADPSPEDVARVLVARVRSGSWDVPGVALIVGA